MGVTKTQAIKAFLNAKTHLDLARMYNHDMECQVNVAQDNGDRIEGEFQGKKWAGYTDETGQVWKAFRIPFNAMHEPEFNDTEIKFDLAAHAEGIGMTGWDWQSRVSRWVAFDFDAIVGHSDKHQLKLNNEDLQRVRDIACEIPWVTVRYSTSGKGLHLYVFLDDVPTANHTEHAALARAILGKLSSLTGFDFSSKVDICGGNMWVWHRKMTGTEGLKLIKQGDTLEDIPDNWRDHLNVIKGVRKKINTPVKADGVPDIEQRFDILAAQRNRVKLDEEHLRLIKFLNENGLYHWWDPDHHMLITHTMHLKQAHKELGLRGIFDTETKGTTTHNCFLFPMRRGAWSVRRYTPGVKEHPSWDQDGAGWTRCYINHDPTLRSASLAYGGLEDPSGGYHFRAAEEATQVANALGANVTIHPHYHRRKTTLKPHKDGSRLILEIEYDSQDQPDEMKGWLHKGTKWVRMVPIQRVNTTEIDSESFDDQIRHLVTENGEDSGWVINSDGRWNDEPFAHIKIALEALGLKANEIKSITGGSVLKPWTLVSKPFQPEYPGDRIWNRRAPQFRYPPTIGDVLNYPTWMSVLSHIGSGLDTAVESDKWCKQNGILTGVDYLKIWIASMLQHPFEPLPYLFIWSEEQETGKSTLHEALQLLFYPGYARVDHALQNPSSFNAELEGTILCAIEETDLSGKNLMAYNRIKDWVTSPMLSIHRKQQTPYMIPNTTHYIHTANFWKNCPQFPGDTRITTIRVPGLPKNTIPKRVLMRQLDKEGPDFLAALLSLDIPETTSRLRVPVVETQDKREAQNLMKSQLELFIDEKCHFAPGAVIPLALFFDAFTNWLDPAERNNWSSKNRVSREMPKKFPKGRLSSDPNWHWGNISFDPPANPNGRMLVSLGDKLVFKD